MDPAKLTPSLIPKKEIQESYFPTKNVSRSCSAWQSCNLLKFLDGFGEFSPGADEDFGERVLMHSNVHDCSHAHKA
jgi:hypothetical protein